MNKPFPPTYAEGYQRGKEDKENHMAPDVDRWIHRWSPWFGEFERGYLNGHLETPYNKEVEKC